MTNEKMNLDSGTQMSRRTFLKASGTVAGIAATAGVGVVATLSDGKPTQAAVDLSNAKTFTSSCTMECLHHNLTGYVIDDKLVHIDTSECEPTKGCLRGYSRVQWANHPDRLKKPMLREGKKGEGKFKEISWDEALDLIVEKINATIKELGNKGLALRTGSGNFAQLTNPVGNAFFAYLGGSTPVVGSLCCQAVSGTMVPMYGTRTEDMRDTIKDSKYILVWGTNPAVTMQSYMPWYYEAIGKGAKMTTIDPRYSETAAKSQEWVPIIPGTDTALCLGMLKIIIEEKLYDLDFLLKHSSVPYLVDKTSGKQLKDEGSDTAYKVFDTVTNAIVNQDQAGIVPALSTVGLPIADQYSTVYDLIYKETMDWTPEKVEEETDVPAGTVIRLAHEYATIKPAMIIQNMGGFQRTEYGSYATGAHIYLSVFTGNVGKAGAGVCDAGGLGNTIKVNNPIPIPDTPKFDQIPAPKFGEYILEEKPGKIGFFMTMTTSMVTQFPNTNAVKKALEKIPFVVVIESLMTSTALYADLVLPCTTIFENENLLASVRNRFVQYMEKAVEPPGEAKSDLWIFTELAKRMGFGDKFDKSPDELMAECLKDTDITLDQLKKAPVRPAPDPFIPYKDGNFKTKTKRAELFMPAWADKKHNPVVTYMRPKESLKGSPDLAGKYPLMAVQRKLTRGIHSTFSSLPWIVEANGDKAHVLMHPDDAKSRNIKTGDKVIVFNDRGEHSCVAEILAHIKPGVIAIENGWWEQLGGSSSHVTNDHVEILSGGHSCNNTLVEIKKEG